MVVVRFNQSLLHPLLLPLLLLLHGPGGGFGEISTFFDPGEDRTLELYPGEDLQGEPQIFHWGAENITGTFESVRQSGIWLVYGEAGYRGENVTALFGEDVLFNIQHSVGSVRYAGNTRSKVFPSLHLYEDSWYRGREYVVEAGPDEGDLVLIPNFRDFGIRARSIIGVGADWTVFSGPNFHGPNCTCLKSTHFSMSSYDGDDAMMRAFFHPDTHAHARTHAHAHTHTHTHTHADTLFEVGSAILGCEVPMKKLCAKVPWKVWAPECPVMSRGVSVC
ncbi:uncharacterized protein LOC123502343 [Portunus trituberculatus]|uniref:uncharacterized protein LOC123502343 n=1 Tax=Portunus trituberculatus TaxID=210409 RepID=UPI001E1D0D3D|nr:uncharacterized protein LOC123502343 [Portunus trituberculatus]